MKKRWQVWAGLAVSGVFLFLALRDVDLPTAWRYVRAAEWRYLAGGWGCLVLSYAARIWRWRTIVRAVGPVPPERQPISSTVLSSLLPGK